MPGVTRVMPRPSSPSSSTTSNALANLTKAAAVALNAVQSAQDRAHTDLLHAIAERDDALKALHDAQLDAKDIEVREEVWKAAHDKSDLTIKHQAETITQLRAEVLQWKAQLTRLEESSRQEIEGWKEQYQRAEHERSRMSARVDELFAEQLAWNAAAHAYTAPFTSRVAYADITEPYTSSSATKRASTSSHRAGGTPHATGRPSLGDDVPPPVTTRKFNAAHSSRGGHLQHRESRSRNASPVRPSTARRNEAADGRGTLGRSAATHTAPVRSQVIRRVTATVDVKEEDETDLESAASGSVYDPDDQPPILPGGRRHRASVSGKPKRIAQDRIDYSQSAYVELDEDAEEADEPEDDELLLGPKPRKPPRTQQTAVPKHPRPSAGAKQSGPAKKRKVDANGGVASGRAGPAKSAKTR